MIRGAKLMAAIGALVAVTAGVVQAETLSPKWAADWVWSLPLAATCIAFHAAVVIGMAAILFRVRKRIEQRTRGRLESAVVAIVTIGGIGWVLAILHGLDALIWSVAYLQLDAFGTMGDAMLYSVDTLAARGASGLDLPQHWRMMGALQATNGVLLFGMSTAFLFGVLIELRITLAKIGR
jgi:hypothetical protein